MTDAQNGAISRLTQEVKALRDQLIANTQIDGMQTNHIQALVNKVEVLEAQLVQQQQINVNFAQRLEALESMLNYDRTGAH